MVRVVLLLAVVGVLVLFFLQNSSVVLPLTILGMKTVELPVAVWVLGAIAAGAITALLTGAVVQLGGNRRSRRRSSGRNNRSGASGTPWTPPPWTGQGAEPQDTPRNGSRRSRSEDDDWGASSSGDDWDDWARGEDSPRTTVRPPTTPPIRDAEFRPLNVETVYPEPDYEPSYSNSYDNTYTSSYSDYRASAPDYYEEPEEGEVWDDWEEEPVRPVPPPPPPPPEDVPPARDIVEIRRDPQSTERTGTIYSFSYRTEEEPEVVTPKPPNDGTTVIQEPVIDVTEEKTPAPPPEEPRIRVIIPPYRSTPEPPPAPPATDDWDDNEEDFDADSTYDADVTDSDVTGDREVWDDWDEDPDEPDSPNGGPSPRSPNGNPPLKF
ncbi:MULTISPECIES: hypothetical protein [unclassified Leptolyngbya]|uniref:hypothetical protein n=1 Tax=unclassified Leptolyngbya TaxID=2650499 RepID=UPI001682FEF2|nr:MULTISPECIES: hypothetical protein [unclassified Leptolyngbya]MBD1913039.1 hypothetical protein [Leptolyngbya sp. FACHB-8]MBD2154460.1 hypothetical protein [Leptolyngbya sp. FACHB-16]